MLAAAAVMLLGLRCGVLFTLLGAAATGLAIALAGGGIAGASNGLTDPPGLCPKSNPCDE